MSDLEVFIQQLIAGFSNGMIIALIALGYTMVYGLIELINFAHGDLCMLGAFLALTLVGLFRLDRLTNLSNDIPGLIINGGSVVLITTLVAVFCAVINWGVDRFAYRPLRHAPRLAPLVSAIGVSFIFINIGLFWGGLPMEVFGMGTAAASPKNFPQLISNNNLLGENNIQFTMKDLLVIGTTLPLMLLLTVMVKFSNLGRAMRAIAQNPVAAQLMGIDVNAVIGKTFLLGGALGGVASVIYALYNNTIHFQMGFRLGVDAFTAAVFGGIGNLPGAVLGGVVIGLVRSLSDQYVATQWTNTVVFLILVLTLVFRPTGLLGSLEREKV